MKANDIDHIYRDGRHYDRLYSLAYMPFQPDLARHLPLICVERLTPQNEERCEKGLFSQRRKGRQENLAQFAFLFVILSFLARDMSDCPLKEQ